MIKPSGVPLVGFEGSRIKPKGLVTLEVHAVDKVLNVKFLVVDSKSGYNAIIGTGRIHIM